MEGKRAEGRMLKCKLKGDKNQTSCVIGVSILCRHPTGGAQSGQPDPFLYLTPL